MSFGFVHSALKEREALSLLRQRKVVSARRDGMLEVDGKACLNFASNDYLGLSQHPDVLQSYVEGLAQYGSSSTASAVLSGYMRPHQILEETLASLLNKDAVLLMNSGFSANQALCHGLFGPDNKSDCNILSDKLMHASFVESARQSSAHYVRFKHNDIAHFSLCLKKCTGNTLVATEGVFSMDGDIGNIAQIQQALAKSNRTANCSDKNSHNAESKTSENAASTQLMVDDAHGFGVIGDTGLGVSSIAGIDSDKIDILMATFGKALGTSGGFIAGSKNLIEYLVNFAKHYVYSTAMPPAQAVATLKSIEIMQHGQERAALARNIDTFKQFANSRGLSLMPSDSAIQPIVIGDSATCVQSASALMNLGIFVGAIRTPTVAKGSERLRITLSALHSDKDIQALVDALCIVREKFSWGQ
ncbi:aminotransferase class I/II-fold pyridoxal phosphate-dependent enzyme [Glaciecola siphonariae]|uniref:8-amino-7-oxononanoate synthase n=1 Tax=Glaciecola siphonariae TaxID=521012 RepID=A0ABV9LR06_9ALTE